MVKSKPYLAGLFPFDPTTFHCQETGLADIFKQPLEEVYFCCIDNIAAYVHWMGI